MSRCWKEFVRPEATEEDEQLSINETPQIKTNVTGEEAVDFYSSLFEENNEINHPTNNKRQEFCKICKEHYHPESKKNHDCSATHGFQASVQPAINKVFELSPNNRGYKLLLKSGWNEKGLGKNEEGTMIPIKTRIKNDRLGLGISPVGEEQVTHKNAIAPPKRKNLAERTIPDNVDQLPIFQALKLLETTEEQTFGITKKHRNLLLQREKVKQTLLYQELYRDSIP